jgi:hypothetical protein
MQVTYNEGWGLAGRPADQPAKAVATARAADAAVVAASGRLVDACTGCDAHGTPESRSRDEVRAITRVLSPLRLV